MSAPITQADWEKLRRESIELAPELAQKLDLPGVLLGYQGRAVSLLDSTAVRVLFIEKSRRIGMTWGLAAAAVLRAGRAKSSGGMDAMYISYSQEMTREFIDAAAMWAKAFAMTALDTQEFLFEDANPSDPSDTRSIQAFRIRFASGFEIVALSSAPRTLRGKQGLVIIDEAAFVDSLKELLKAALAFLMWGGQVVVCSTHDGAENPFNEAVQDILAGRSKYAHMRVDFDDALKEGLYQRICLVTGKEWSPATEAAWRQEIIDFYGDGADEELFCVPAQGSGAWLSAPLIEARMTLTPAEAPVIRIELPGNYLQLTRLQQAQLFEPQFDLVKRAVDTLTDSQTHAFGYDPARKLDPAVMSLLAIETDLRRRSALTVEMRGVPFDEQKRVARHILKNAPRLIGAAIDATGMGMNLAEDLGREFGLRESDDGAGLVWAIMLRSPWYNSNFPPLKAAFEDGTIALTRDAEHVTDLRMVKVVRGVPMVPDEREGEKGRKRHGDFAVALGMAHFASRMRWVEFGYEPVRDATQPPRPGIGPQGFMVPDHSGDDMRGGGWTRPPLGASIRGGI